MTHRYYKTAAEFDDDLVATTLSTQQEAPAVTPDTAPPPTGPSGLERIATMSSEPKVAFDVDALLLEHRIQTSLTKMANSGRDHVVGFLELTEKAG